MMILPTIGLLLNISQAGIPSALFTLTASPRYNRSRLFISCTLLSFIQTVLCCGIVFGFSQYFTNINPYLPTILLFIFIACISALIRSYHLGNEQAHIPALSQVVEEIVRISFILYFYFYSKTLTLQNVFTAMLFGETSSCVYMLCHLKTNQKFPSLHEAFDGLMYKDILSISIPTSITTLIHSFCHWLVPLVYRHYLLSANYSINQINHTYGILNGYVLGLLMVPTFLSTVIYRIILPKITKSLDNPHRTKHLIFQGMMVCLLIGVPFSLFFHFFPNLSLQLLFDTTEGANYLKYTSIPFLIYYLQPALQAYLQASHQQHILLIASIIQSVTMIALLVFLLPILGPFAYIFSFLSGLIIYTVVSFIAVYKHLFFHKE